MGLRHPRLPPGRTCRCRCWCCSTRGRGTSTPATAGCSPARTGRPTSASASAWAGGAARPRCGRDLDRLCAAAAPAGRHRPDARPGRVVGGWLRMGGTGTPPAARNVLLAGDAAGLINPLQGEGIAPAMVSARAAARGHRRGPGAGPPARYTEAMRELMRRTWPARRRCRRRCWPGPGWRRRACACSPRRRCAGWWPAPGRCTGTAWPTARRRGRRPAPPPWSRLGLAAGQPPAPGEVSSTGSRTCWLLSLAFLAQLAHPVGEEGREHDHHHATMRSWRSRCRGRRWSTRWPARSRRTRPRSSRQPCRAGSAARTARGTSMMPQISDMNVRTNGSARPTGMAQAPRPSMNRSARSMSERVISTYRPNFSTSGRPPCRPTP